MIFKETLIQSLSFAVRDSRFPPHMPRTSPLSSSVFHTASALSAPLGHLPLEGKAGNTRETCHSQTLGHRPIYTLRRFPNFYALHYPR